MDSELDYRHAIQDIRRALHDPRRKAAVLVGAGFSRNARHQSDPIRRLPGWAELAHGLAERLYPDTDELQRVKVTASETSAATRLASEFEVAFGRAALQDFVRTAVNDDGYAPSDTHRLLLDLPWADVFTTNYDRLLESVSRSLWKQRYEVVRSASDLPVARRPRIIKLHGNLPDLDNLVITEEDYRTFPRRCAPFVATVQASLSENILCLIGFSGNDPNFLAWMRWLRDEMPAFAPNAYLFTRTPLRPFQRTLLEQRRIVPISLSSLYQGAREGYESAYRELLIDLAQSPDATRPIWDRGPRNSGDDCESEREPLHPQHSDWIGTALRWRRNRQRANRRYVMTRDGAERLRDFTSTWISSITPELLDSWTPPEAAFVLHELVWRWSTSLQPLPDHFVFSVLDKQLERYSGWRNSHSSVTGDVPIHGTAIPLSEIDSGVRFLICECMRHSREIGDVNRFSSFAETLKPIAASDTDTACYLRHQEVLLALSCLAISRAKELLESWNTSDCDPIWAARRAGLCLEVGDIVLATKLLSETLDRLRSAPMSRDVDIRAMSIEGIVLNLQRLLHFASVDFRNPSERNDEDLLQRERVHIQDRLLRLGDFGCNPNDFHVVLEDAVSPEPVGIHGDRRQEGFAIGSEVRHVSYGNEPQLNAAYTTIRFIEDAGLPLSISSRSTLNVAEKAFRGAVATIAHFAPKEAAGLFLRSRDTKCAQRVLTRGMLAAISNEVAQSLLRACVEYIESDLKHYGDDTSDAVRSRSREWRLEFGLLTVSRLSVRASAEQAEDVAVRMLQIANQHSVRFAKDSLKEAARLVFGCLSRDSLGRLSHTIASTISIIDSYRDIQLETITDFVEIAATTPGVRLEGLRQIADRLLDTLCQATGDSRKAASQAIAHLAHEGHLTESQLCRFRDAMYSLPDPSGLPHDTGCYDSLVLLLPKLSRIDEREAFRSKYFNEDSLPAMWKVLRSTFLELPFPVRSSGRGIRWTLRDLERILLYADSWLTKHSPPEAQPSRPKGFLSQFAQDHEAVASEFRDWLATVEGVLITAVRRGNRLASRALAVIDRASVSGWCTIQSSPAKCVAKAMSVEQGVEAIRNSLGGPDSEHVLQSNIAIHRWHQFHANRMLPLPNAIHEFVAVQLETCRGKALPRVVSTAMAILDSLPSATMGRFLQKIRHAMQSLLVETCYDSDNSDGRMTIEQKLRVRVWCARMAAKARQCGIKEAWVDEWYRSIAEDVFADVRSELT